MHWVIVASWEFFCCGSQTLRYPGSRARRLSSCTWDLSFPTRDQTHVSHFARQTRHRWTITQVPACMLSPFRRVRLLSIPWTAALQAPLSMGFSRQESGSGLPFPSPGDLPDPGIEPAIYSVSCIASGFCTTSTTWEAPAWPPVKRLGSRYAVASEIMCLKVPAFLTVALCLWWLQKGTSQDRRGPLDMVGCWGPRPTANHPWGAKTCGPPGQWVCRQPFSLCWVLGWLCPSWWLDYNLRRHSTHRHPAQPHQTAR